jgi:hypothetical protein
MTLNEFKEQAGVEALNFYTSEKGGLYAPTSIGTVFCAKDYKPKNPVQTIIPFFDDNGRLCYRLTNKKVAFSK